MVSRKLKEIQSQFYEIGKQDEKFVMEAVTKTFGGECTPSSRKDDMKKHIDFWWNSPKKGKIGIDVKGMNKAKRSDKTFDDEIHWLELQNVKGGDGWLKGDAEYIAFRTYNDIIFVNREKLLNFALESINGKEVVYDTPSECYVPYKRKKWGRDDLSLKALNTDLRELADFCIDCT